MTELGNLSNTINSILTRLNEIEKSIESLKSSADKSDAYMALASKLAARNHEIRELHGHVACASAETPLDPSIPVWQR